jgi:hypothetical protein
MKKGVAISDAVVARMQETGKEMTFGPLTFQATDKLGLSPKVEAFDDSRVPWVLEAQAVASLKRGPKVSEMRGRERERERE